MHRLGLRSGLTVVLFLIACSATIWSQGNQTTQQKPMIPKDINAVLKDHEKELMATPGVIGVYVGLLSDDKTPCLKVMVVKETDDLRRGIPKSIEGFPVLIEESGIIRPMDEK